VRGNVKAVNESLLRQGVIVRPIGVYEMPEHLRVTVGLESENKKFLRSLEMALDMENAAGKKADAEIAREEAAGESA
jgi:histidinol-phosphate aminotransferase